MTRPAFRDRAEAGRALAEAVASLISRHPEMTDPVVLALPRGGVPVALETARRLKAPLDLVMVRKLGVPDQPELAAGAVVDGDDPQTVFNREIMAVTGLTEADLAPIRERELAEIERRRGAWLSGRAPVPIEGRDAIVVDDGIATGATTRAALKGLRRKRPRSLTLAVPLAPADTVERLRGEVDHLVCLVTPEPFRAIGLHYGRFDQLRDEDVTRLMAEAAG